MVAAGLVGRPHGLDGSFYVAEPAAALLALGTSVTVGGRAREIVRRAGTDQRPIVRLEGCEDRAAALALRGEQLLVEAATLPPLGPDEWWAEQLEGAHVFDGDREVGVVRRLLALPSCECLEVERDGERPRPAGAARARRDPPRRRRGGPHRDRPGVPGGGAVKLDVVTLFPDWFEWFRSQRHVANALAAGSALTLINPRDHTPLGGGQVDDSPFGGGAGMVLRVDVMDATLREHYDCDPVTLRNRRRVIALSPGGRLLDDALVGELAAEPALTFLCGRYEGFDERIVEHFASDVISVGRYVLAGGELAAMVCIDAVAAQAAGSAGAPRLGARGVLQRRARGDARVPAVHATGRVPRLEGARRSCSRATTRRSAAGGWRARASAGAEGSPAAATPRTAAR